MKRIKTWHVFDKYFQTTECMVRVSVITDMDCRYHARVYTKDHPNHLWHCFCEDGSWYKGPTDFAARKAAEDRAMELFHSEFDKDCPIEINYSEDNALCFGGNFDNEIEMKERILECLMVNFPEVKFGFTN